MTLSPSTAWYEAVCRADARVRFLVAVYDGTHTWKAVGPGAMDSASDLYSSEIPAAVQRVEPVGVELDPFTRRVEYGQMFVSVDDAWLRPLLVSYRLKGQRVNISVGAASLDEADFLNYAVNQSIEEVTPEDGHTITIACLGQFARLAMSAIHGTWIGVHPLEALYFGDDSGILEVGGASSVNANSFKPADDYDNSTGRVYCLAYDASDGTPTADLKDSGDLTAWSNNFQVLPDAASEAAGDGFLIGHKSQFETIVFDDLATGNGQVATWSGDGGKYQYSTGEGSWSDLSVTDSTDSTNQDGKRTLQQAGEISFDIPVDWVVATYNSVEAYWVRYNITAATLTQTAITDDTNKDEPFIPDDRSHVIVSRIDQRLETLSTALMGESVDDAVQCLSQAQACARLLNGHLIENEDGEIEFVKYSSSKSAARDLNEDDIIPGTFRQDSLDVNVINRILVNYARNINGAHALRFALDDTASQTAYAFPGESDRVIAREFGTDWCDTVMGLGADLASGFTGATVVRRCHALSGNRAELWATVSDRRPIYLLLDSRNISYIDNAEIIRAESLTRGSDVSYEGTYEPEINDYLPGVELTEACTINTLTRGLYTSTTSAHQYGGYGAALPGATRVLDLTPIVMLAQDLLERFSYGCPLISFETPIRNYPLQVGDLVTLTYGAFVGYGMDGLTTSQKFEIVGKQADFVAGKITLSLAYANENTPTYGSLSGKRSGLADELSDVVEDELFGRTYIVDGLEVTQDAGLVGEVADGSISDGLRRASLPEALSHTFPASDTIYVYAGFSTTQPGVAVIRFRTADVHYNSEVWLATVTTDGAGITNIDTTGQETAPLLGAKLKAGSGPLSKLSQAGYLDSLTSVTTRSLDDITDGATYSRVKTSGVTGGLVDTAGLVSGCVTTAKVGQNAIGTYQTVADTFHRNLDPDFNDWSRG